MSDKIKVYLVGGAVRDQLMGLKPKDLDYCVAASSYEAMREYLIRRGAKIFLETPQYFTIRCNLPDLGSADFVLARKEGAYSDHRRPDFVEVGDLESELSRRDFTMNAIAIDTESGEIIDPFGGKQDIENKLIRCVGTPEERFTEDGLRMFRALRFNITKGFELSLDISLCLADVRFFEPRLVGVSLDRIRDEIFKCFRHDTLLTLRILEAFHEFRNWTFSRPDLWLKPTSEAR